MLNISNRYVSKIVFILLTVDVLILLAAAYLGMNIRLIEDLWPVAFMEFLPSACIFAVAMVVGMSALVLYKRAFSEGLQTTFLRLMPAFALGLSALALIFYLVPNLYLGRGILMLAFFIAGAGILMARVIFFKLSEFRFLVPRIIFLGASELAKVRDIVVAVQNRRGGNSPIQELLECKLNGIHAIDAATFVERETCQIRLDSLQPSRLIFGTGFDQSIVRTFVKRLFDLSISTIILAASIPAMLLTAFCIYVEDRSPIFYRQERVGKNGHSFMVLKFRSMRNDAEKAGKPQWAATNDPRTTRVGSIIRKFHIDELPQILNVFNGDMSFVGPRPERPFFVKKLCEEILHYNVRHSIKPGITGWAQVRYQYGASTEDAIQKLQYDLYYVKNNSLFSDILILIDTLRVVFFGAGR